MSNALVEDREKKFETFKAMETKLSKVVRGFVERASNFDAYDDYAAHANSQGTMAIEAAHMRQATDMYNAVKNYESKFSEPPKIDMHSPHDWSVQLRNQTMMQEAGVSLDLYMEGEQGQLTITNGVNNSVTIVDIEFVSDPDTGLGHLQLGLEDRRAMPHLERFLRNQMLSDPAQTLDSSYKDYEAVDADWMLASMDKNRVAESVLSEISTSTGPVPVSLSKLPKPEIENDHVLGR